MASELPDKQGRYTKAQDDAIERIKPWRFRPGVSGNPKGRPPGSGRLLKRIIDRLDADDGKLADLAIDKFFDLVFDADDGTATKMMKDLVDRIEGTAIKRREITLKSESKLVVLEDEPEEDDDAEQEHE